MGRPKIPWRALITNYRTWINDDGSKEFQILSTMQQGGEIGRQTTNIIYDTLTAKTVAYGLLLWVAERNDYGQDFSDLVDRVMEFTGQTPDLSNVRFLPDRMEE